MGFNPKNLTTFFAFVCILCGLTGWAVIELLIWIGSHISIGYMPNMDAQP